MDAEKKGGGPRHPGHSKRKFLLLAAWENGSHGKATRIESPEFWTRTEPKPNFPPEAEEGSLSKLRIHKLFDR
jgi:hypothetical protein